MPSAIISTALGQHFFPSLCGVQIAIAPGDDSAVAIYCPNLETLRSVTSDLSQIARYCNTVSIKFIETWVIVEKELRLCDRLPVATLRGIMQNTIKLLSETELYSLFNIAATQGTSLSLVSNKDHRGILTTNNQGSGVSVPEWIGQDMSEYWEPSELRRYLSDLEQYGHLTNYRWRAFRMDAGRQQIEQIGSVQRVKVWGLDCRLVAVEHCEIIG